MRLSIMFIAAASLAACGSPQPDPPAPEDAGVTIELPPEPAPPPAVEQPATPPEPAEAPPPEPAKSEEPPAPPKVAPPAPKAEESPRAEEPPPETPEEPRPAGGRPPLPDATIARTIERIGYRCGTVVSAARVEGGASGTPTFRIACSSGETYRGTNRGGRMYFRPWDR